MLLERKLKLLKFPKIPKILKKKKTPGRFYCIRNVLILECKHINSPTGIIGIKMSIDQIEIRNTVSGLCFHI